MRHENRAAVLPLPIGGVVSILHRASGAFLSLAIPCLLYTLMLSLRSPEDFADVRAFFSGGLGWLIGLAPCGRCCITSWPACAIWASISAGRGQGAGAQDRLCAWGGHRRASA
jgi:hypothetical protein